MVTAHARIHQSYFLCEIMMDKLMLKGYPLMFFVIHARAQV